MSVKLRSRNQSCVDGFRYTQKETGWQSWTSDPVTLWDFNALCNAVFRHRQANPRFKLSLDMNSIMEEVDTANAERMTTIPGAQSYYVEAGPAMTFTAPLRSLPQAAAEGVKKLNAGRKLIAEWRAEGFEVVNGAEADRRAHICTQCPKNGKGGLESWFTVAASGMVKKEIEEIHGAGLVSAFDDKLGICEACLCPLKVKVFTPLPLILKHMLPEVKAQLDPRCWIL